jgi:hypothetical protein
MKGRIEIIVSQASGQPAILESRAARNDGELAELILPSTENSN